jgi:hypothetical protein
MGIAGAIFEGSRAQASALTLEQERRDHARQLQELDDLLESVESQNLHTEHGVPVGVTAQIAAVARTLAVPPPPAVLRAKSGARLHEALLAWQGALLDTLRPHRLRFADRFD